MRFEWDPRKAASNLSKHEVAFEDAATVFEDPLFITLLDEEHSTDEERYITVGASHRGQTLLVAHTDREDTIRIISARRATKYEEEFYAGAE